MGKGKYKKLAMMLSGILMFCSVPIGTEAAETKDIDIYLIAGQSNAAGCSTFDKLALYEQDVRYVNGFKNIYYTGCAGAPGMEPTKKPLQLVTVGCGVDENKIGPEVGMAESLSEYYNNETGKYAGFIKFAITGTTLLNSFDISGNVLENWAPPSYRETLTFGVTENTGKLYDTLLVEVERQLEEYKTAGFNPTIKGMYWMQGESDIGNEKMYAEVFQTFASEIRADLTRVTGQRLENMPIIVGEVSQTHISADSAQMGLNKAFIEMQRTLPTLVPNCYLINSSKYDQNNLSGAVGTDSYHWNGTDCIEIGKEVGECIKEIYFSTNDTKEPMEENDTTGTDAPSNTSNMSMIQKLALGVCGVAVIVLAIVVVLLFKFRKVK